MQDFQYKENLEVSVIIPCLNEEETLAAVLDSVVKTLADAHISSEIIVVDNGSEDKSIQVAQQYDVRIIVADQRGYGSALKAGISAANGTFTIFGDADGSYDFSYIPTFLTFLKAGNDMVIGSRICGKIEDGAMPFLHRYVGTPILTFLINCIYGLQVSDSNSGMRGFRTELGKDLKMQSQGMEFISEMLIMGSFQGMKIYEFPMNFYKDKRSKPPHLRTFRDGIRNLAMILKHVPGRLSLLLKKSNG